MKVRRWTVEEDKYIIDNYLSSQYSDIANKLDRKISAVRGRRLKLRLPLKGSGCSIKEGTCRNNISKQDLIYLAGLFDGEGTISIISKDGRKSTRFSIGMNAHELVSSLKSITSCGIVYTNKSKITIWSVNKINDLKVLLPQIIPFLRLKKEKAQLLLNTVMTYKRGQTFLPTTKRINKINPYRHKIYLCNNCQKQISRRSMMCRQCFLSRDRSRIK